MFSLKHYTTTTPTIFSRAVELQPLFNILLGTKRFDHKYEISHQSGKKKKKLLLCEWVDYEIIFMFLIFNFCCSAYTIIIEVALRATLFQKGRPISVDGKSNDANK